MIPCTRASSRPTARGDGGFTWLSEPGREFLEGLRDDREVWLEGERVEDVTTHPKLRRMAETLANLYDLQHDPETAERMTFTSPKSGDPISLSFLIPESADDLIRRKGALETTARASFGMLGRTPDYCNIIITAMRQMAFAYGRERPALRPERDWTITNTLARTTSA